MVKKILLVAIVCCSNLFFVRAQTHGSHGTDTKWSKGGIILSDGTELAGFIRNNEKGNIISFKENYDGKSFESFRAPDILSLEYFDQDQEAMRRFLSLATTNKTSGEEDIYLYEILREFEQFAVLSFLGRSKDHRTNDNVTIQPILGKPVFSQTEEIYFMNENGERELYMTVELQDVKGEMFKYKTDKGYVDDPLLPARYMDHKDWIQMEAFVKSTNLKIDNKEKLLIFLDHYGTLID